MSESFFTDKNSTIFKIYNSRIKNKIFINPKKVTSIVFLSEYANVFFYDQDDYCSISHDDADALIAVISEQNSW